MTEELIARVHSFLFRQKRGLTTFAEIVGVPITTAHKWKKEWMKRGSAGVPDWRWPQIEEKLRVYDELQAQGATDAA